MKKYLLIVLIVVTKTGFSQSTGTPIAHDTDTSFFVIHKDPRVDLLVKKQAAINEETSRDSRRSMKGFRLMITNTNKRDDAIAAKTMVYTYFPELKAYLLYQSPYFKLKAGNFKTRDEADAYRKKLNIYFPKGVFIINDIIEVKPEKNKEQDEL